MKPRSSKIVTHLTHLTQSPLQACEMPILNVSKCVKCVKKKMTKKTTKKSDTLTHKMTHNETPVLQMK